MKKIFIIEDDKLLANEIKKLLDYNGFQSNIFNNFEEDIDYFSLKKYDLIILDINLPRVSGYEILLNIKDKISVPVLILTSRDDISDELRSFDLGADEFLTKPISGARLIARSKKILNIYEKFSDEIKIKDLSLETSTNKLSYKDSFIILTQIEGDLLRSLMQAYPNTLTKDELLVAAWNTQYIDENILHVNINRLRKKLSSIGVSNFIKSERSIGYRIDAEVIWSIVS